MNRKFTLAAVATAAFVVLGACSKNDDNNNDTGLGSTTGAMATPPAAYPAAGATTSTIPNTTGALTPSDSGDSAKWTNADSARHNMGSKTTTKTTTKTSTKYTKKP